MKSADRLLKLSVVSMCDYVSQSGYGYEENRHSSDRDEGRRGSRAQDTGFYYYCGKENATRVEGNKTGATKTGANCNDDYIRSRRQVLHSGLGVLCSPSIARSHV